MNLVTEVSMKTLIRRIVALMLAMLCTFAVFACKAVEQPDSSKEPGNTKQPDATPTGTQYTPPTNGSPYNVTIENEIEPKLRLCTTPRISTYRYSKRGKIH